MIRLSLGPFQGITDASFRNVFKQHFGGIENIYGGMDIHNIGKYKKEITDIYDKFKNKPKTPIKKKRPQNTSQA